MTKSSKMPEFTQPQLCFLLGVTSMHLTRLEREGVVRRIDRGQYAAESVPNYIQGLRERGKGSDCWHEARTRKMVEQARALEADRLVREGELAPIAVFEKALTAVVLSTRSRLLAIPNKCGSLITHIIPAERAVEVVELVRKLIREALLDLSGTEVNERGEVVRRRHTKEEAA